MFELKKKHNNNVNNDALIDTHKEFIIAAAKGLAFALLLKYTVLEDYSIIELFPIFCVPWGWAFINYLMSSTNKIYIVPIYFYLFIYPFKFVLSFLIGMPCFIYQLIKYILAIIRGGNLKWMNK